MTIFAVVVLPADMDDPISSTTGVAKARASVGAA
jgi:hypothetical protein